jgi:hypothetical protein
VSLSDVAQVQCLAPWDRGTVYNVMRDSEPELCCEAPDDENPDEMCNSRVTYWISLPDSDSASNLVGVCTFHFQRDFGPAPLKEG